MFHHVCMTKTLTISQTIIQAAKLHTFSKDCRTIDNQVIRNILFILGFFLSWEEFNIGV